VNDRYRWTILAVGAVAQGVVSGMQHGMAALGPALRDELGLSLAQVGVVLAALSWGVMSTLLVWGRLADLYGERIVIAIGLSTGSAALVWTSSAASFGALLAGIALAGALSGAASIASGRAVIGWFGRHQRGFALGIRQMAVPLGGAIAALTLPQLAIAGGLRAAVLGLAVAAALGAVAAAIWIREPPPRPATAVPPPVTPPPLRDGRVWRLAGGSALIVCAQSTIVAFVVLFLHDHRAVSAGKAAAVLAAIQLGGAAARLIAGRRSDLAGVRIPPLRRLALATMVAVFGTALLADAPLILLVPVLISAGVLAMSWNGLSFTAVAEISGRDRAGTAIGLQQTVMRLLAAGCGIAFGALVAASSWSFGFAVLAVFPLAGWWVIRPLVGEEEHRLRLRSLSLQTSERAARP